MKNVLWIPLLFVCFVSFAQNADDIIGQYLLPNGLELELYKVGNAYSGKIVALNGYEDGQTRDVENPEASRRDDLLVGKEIITNLVFDEDEKIWEDGIMYGPEKGIYVNLEVTDFNENEITIVGSKFIFWKTMQWKKIK